MAEVIDIPSIPDALKEGENWHLLDIDPDWLWLARDSVGEVVGMLVAAPCHGLVLVWRVKMLPEAPPMAFARLLRRFVQDIWRRGCLGYFTMLDVQRPEEAALMRIAFRAGGIIAGSASVIFGSVNARHVPREGE
jgi:hypothetical protein